jgi:hypothetical protein
MSDFNKASYYRILMSLRFPIGVGHIVKVPRGAMGLSMSMKDSVLNLEFEKGETILKENLKVFCKRNSLRSILAKKKKAKLCVSLIFFNWILKLLLIDFYFIFLNFLSIN